MLASGSSTHSNQSTPVLISSGIWGSAIRLSWGKKEASSAFKKGLKATIKSRWSMEENPKALVTSYKTVLVKGKSVLHGELLLSGRRVSVMLN